MSDAPALSSNGVGYLAYMTTPYALPFSEYFPVVSSITMARPQMFPYPGEQR